MRTHLMIQMKKREQYVLISSTVTCFSILSALLIFIPLCMQDDEEYEPEGSHSKRKKGKKRKAKSEGKKDKKKKKKKKNDSEEVCALSLVPFSKCLLYITFLTIWTPLV